VLKSITQSTSGQYRVVRLASNNSSVCGGEIIGDRVVRNLPNNNTGQGGSGPNDFEVGDGIDINATSGNVVFGTNIHDCCCDGIYIYNQATNFMISDVTSNHNRRQGISVVGANTGTIQYCYATNTTGNDPACGIDMEPSGGGTVTYITVNYCTITGNAGGGIQLSAGSGSNGPSNTTITNNTITGNGGSDYGIGGIYADDSSSYGTISNNNCSSNIAGGDDGGIDLQNVSHFVVNNNTCNYNGGYGLYFSSTTSTTYHGNTLISNTSGTVGGDGSATAN
jgi:parallel beta-helix repeat protein